MLSGLTVYRVGNGKFINISMRLHVVCPNNNLTPLRIHVSIPSQVALTGPTSAIISPNAIQQGINASFFTTSVSTNLGFPNQIAFTFTRNGAGLGGYDYKPIFNFTYYSVGF